VIRPGELSTFDRTESFLASQQHGRISMSEPTKADLEKQVADLEKKVKQLEGKLEKGDAAAVADAQHALGEEQGHRARERQALATIRKHAVERPWPESNVIFQTLVKLNVDTSDFDTLAAGV
jgi:hypothetical protein